MLGPIVSASTEAVIWMGMHLGCAQTLVDTDSATINPAQLIAPGALASFYFM
jgi:hypothetical protein